MLLLAVSRFIKEILKFNKAYSIPSIKIYEYICKTNRLGVQTFNAWNETNIYEFARNLEGLFRWMYKTMVKEEILMKYK